MREHYIGGREHSAIKHVFLRHYLEALAFKTLQGPSSANRSFAYIDGFTGPWGAKDDKNYIDTSFGVALSVLTRVKQHLNDVTIRCVFCETRKAAFLKLESYIAAHRGDIHVKCIHGRFEENIADIIDFVGNRGFTFAFIDPKGFKVDTAAIAPLLKNRWSEVVFNFMDEFIGRFPDFEKVESAYAALLGDGDWRSHYDSTPQHLPNEERVLLLFRKALKEQWKFSHILELPIQKRNRERTFYKLIYGTRSPYGVLTFRDSQAKAEKEGYAIAAEARQQVSKEMFAPDDEAELIATSVGVGSQKNCLLLREVILKRLSTGDHLSLLQLTADVLETIPARETNVKSAVGELLRENSITMLNRDGTGGLSRRSIVRLNPTAI